MATEPLVVSPASSPPATESATGVGSYFIANYPPFSQWRRDQLPELAETLARPPVDRARPLGLYLHIPFCRKRCRFCYFRVYTDQNARDIERYAQALAREVELLNERPAFAGRPLQFVYFGGGTPSYLSSRQLRALRDRLAASIAWEGADEVTFECEPGTLSLDKVQTLRDIGVTRVSLGVENFSDQILEENGRAHLSPEIFRAYDWLRQVGFPQINIDLIAGMVGETDENWTRNIEQALQLAPDNITIYQMELPFNTLIAREMQSTGQAAPVADWPTKRRWVNEAFETLGARGYHVSSAQELVRDPARDHFVYRDQVWRGADLMAAGVASFGHVQGVHYQNLDQLTDYLEALEAGLLPHNRALRISPQQALIREFVLQLKEGRVDPATFQAKFGVNPLVEFAGPLERQQAAGYLSTAGGQITLTRRGLLQVDTLLTEYFEPEFRSVRYT
jgi:oxygen-independent coproporphyrinogen-3 oxidase